MRGESGRKRWGWSSPSRRGRGGEGGEAGSGGGGRGGGTAAAAVEGCDCGRPVGIPGGRTAGSRKRLGLGLEEEVLHAGCSHWTGWGTRCQQLH